MRFPGLYCGFGASLGQGRASGGLVDGEALRDLVHHDQNNAVGGVTRCQTMVQYDNSRYKKSVSYFLRYQVLKKSDS